MCRSPQDGLASHPRKPWGLGPEIHDGYRPQQRRWPPTGACSDSFGHSGASGALVWFDRHSGVALALLPTLDALTGVWGVGRGTLTGHVLAAFA